MTLPRRDFLGFVAAFAALPAWSEGGARAKGRGVAPWERPDGTASDATLVRRLHLDLAGRIPTEREVRDYLADRDPDKKIRLVDRLLASDDFADYWSMRLCDLLRVKSEFPINLWPNAVYVYHRRLREAVRSDEPWDALARALITARGSNFRDAETNFLRATSDRSPAGLAATVVRTFLDEDLETWDAPSRARAVRAFENIVFKPTREWKEELVYANGEERRAAFADELLASRRDRFAAAFAGYVAYWFFGRRGADGALGKTVSSTGFHLKDLCRAIVLSEGYARGSVTGGFPLRRLDAEVLEDALATLAGLKRSHQSIAPEPFTFLPGDRKTVLIEDGSITSSFLARFGRPARDTGLPEERLNDVTAKQRLYLFNSGRLFQALGNVRGDVESIYLQFLARRPTDAEKRAFLASKLRLRVLPWCLLNGREFLYRT